MDANSRRSLMSTLFILLLICALCVVPAMAGTQTNVVEDGVHLLKNDEHPTKLDAAYYKNDADVDFVVDGNQFYWVHIGSVKAKGLTTVWWLNFVVATVFLFPIIFTLIAWYYESRRRFPSYHKTVFSPTPGQSFVTGWKNMVVFLIPVMLVGLVSMVCVVSGLLPNALTHAACDGFVDAKASDGTILLQVDKMHPETNQLYMKSGVNLTTLTHLSSSGTVLTEPKSVLGSGSGVTMI